LYVSPVSPQSCSEKQTVLSVLASDDFNVNVFLESYQTVKLLRNIHAMFDQLHHINTMWQVNHT